MGMPKWALLTAGSGKMRICPVSAHPQTFAAQGPLLHVAVCLAPALIGAAAGCEAALFASPVRLDVDLLVAAVSREVALFEAATRFAALLVALEIFVYAAC